MTGSIAAGQIGLTCFALSSIFYLTGSARTRTWLKWNLVPFILFVLATVAVTMSMILGTSTGRLGDYTGALLTSVLGWLFIVAYVVFRIRPLGMLLAPLATLILLIQSFAQPSPPDIAGVSSLLATVHVALAVLGQAFAILSCAFSIFYLWQQQALKRKQLAGIPRQLPALDRLDGWLISSLWIGFVLITLSLVTGAFLTQKGGWPGASPVEAKVLWAITVWGWYLTILILRNVFGRNGKRIAQFSLGGFLLLAGSFFGMIFVDGGVF